MLTVLQVRLQLVQSQRGRAAEAGVVAADLEFGQHVAHDAGHGSEVGQRHHRPVNGANLLLGKPLRYTGIAESMLAVGGLEDEWRVEGNIYENIYFHI